MKKIGPDILKIKPAELLERLGGFQRRQLASLLLDQQLVAGIGNYLRSEILFVARLPYNIKPVDCSPEQLEKLAQAAVSVARQSYRHNGITNDLKHARTLKAAGKRRRFYRHWVFSREAQPCWVCGNTIQKTEAAGRRIYFCPNCQKQNQIS